MNDSQGPERPPIERRLQLVGGSDATCRENGEQSDPPELRKMPAQAVMLLRRMSREQLEMWLEVGELLLQLDMRRL
jgi:hypothetical protein